MLPRDPGLGSQSHDIVLPERLFPSSPSQRWECPEIALMRAVLEEAIVCFRRGFTSRGRRARSLAREAKQIFNIPFGFYIYIESQKIRILHHSM
jgi:hypothetical protein